MVDVKAATPFHFIGCLELREMLGRKAADLQQLMAIIEEAPLDSIYYHTHSYFLRYEHGPTLFPSDFATWAAVSVRDRVVSERLGLIDPFEFKDLESLRAQIVSTIDDHCTRAASRNSGINCRPWIEARCSIIFAKPKSARDAEAAILSPG